MRAQIVGIVLLVIMLAVTLALHYAGYREWAFWMGLSTTLVGISILAVRLFKS